MRRKVRGGRDAVPQPIFEVLRSNLVRITRWRFERDGKVVEDAVEELLNVGTQAPFRHGDFENGKDDHEVAGIFFAVEVRNEVGNKVVVAIGYA